MMLLCLRVGFQVHVGYVIWEHTIRTVLPWYKLILLKGVGMDRVG